LFHCVAAQHRGDRNEKKQASFIHPQWRQLARGSFRSHRPQAAAKR
jgi:hypothetical protein